MSTSSDAHYISSLFEDASLSDDADFMVSLLRGAREYPVFRDDYLADAGGSDWGDGELLEPKAEEPVANEEAVFDYHAFIEKLWLNAGISEDDSSENPSTRPSVPDAQPYYLVLTVSPRKLACS